MCGCVCERLINRSFPRSNGARIRRKAVVRSLLGARETEKEQGFCRWAPSNKGCANSYGVLGAGRALLVLVVLVGKLLLNLILRAI